MAKSERAQLVWARALLSFAPPPPSWLDCLDSASLRWSGTGDDATADDGERRWNKGG